MTYFRLGFVGNDPFPGHEFKEGRIAIPYITPTGIVQIRFRAVPTNGEIGGPVDGAKMLSLANAGTTIYNSRDFLIQSDLIVITEGESDAWAVHMAGLPAIGFPGAKSWDKIRSVSRAFRFRKVIILADNDDHGEGKEFAEKVQQSIRQARIILMPDGHDASSFVKEYGVEALKSKIGA